MFTPPSTIINRCKERITPPVKDGGMDGKVTLLFSTVKIKNTLNYQLEIISTPKNYELGKMMFQTSIIHRGVNIKQFEKPIKALLTAIEKTGSLKVGQIEFNYFKSNIEPISKADIKRFIDLDSRLCENIVNSCRQPLELVVEA